MMQIVEGGCIDPSGGKPLRAKLAKQGVELLSARPRRFVYVAGSPWRAYDKRCGERYAEVPRRPASAGKDAHARPR
jgi:hypothetical protein